MFSLVCFLILKIIVTIPSLQKHIQYFILYAESFHNLYQVLSFQLRDADFQFPFNTNSTLSTVPFNVIFQLR